MWLQIAEAVENLKIRRLYIIPNQYSSEYNFYKALKG